MSGALLRTSVVAMTTTLLTTTTRTPATDVLRRLLDGVLDSVDDDDRYSSRTPAGRALVSLTALARRAAGALCLGPGVALTGPGVEMRRGIAAPLRLLGGAGRAAGGGVGGGAAPPRPGRAGREAR